MWLLVMLQPILVTMVYLSIQSPYYGSIYVVQTYHRSKLIRQKKLASFGRLELWDIDKICAWVWAVEHPQTAFMGQG